MMKKAFLAVLLVLIGVVGAYDLVIKSKPCEDPIRYALGSVDERFGIPREELKAVLSQAELVWENPLGMELFQYDPSANFKINFVFDERQKRTNEERNLRSKIDTNGDSYDSRVEEYNRAYDGLQRRQAAYEVRKEQFAKELAAYNREVDYWNKRKDIPQSDYERINSLKTQIQAAQKDLDKEMLAINAQTASVNAFAERINNLARNLNLDVEFYNGKFGKPKEFDQGVYTGNAINIYQFSEKKDLQMVLAHELGHALNIGHLENPEAIMHYLMQKQDLENIHATSSDVEELMAVCKIK